MAEPDRLKTIHNKQKKMIGVLEQFEDLLLDTDYSRHGSGAEQIGCLFRQIQNRIDTHLRFETEYLLPLLDQGTKATTLSGLLRQREVILALIAKVERLMIRTQNDNFGVGAWDELIESALTLIRATFSLFHWEEREFIHCVKEG